MSKLFNIIVGVFIIIGFGLGAAGLMIVIGARKPKDTLTRAELIVLEASCLQSLQGERDAEQRCECLTQEVLEDVEKNGNGNPARSIQAAILACSGE